MMPANLGIDVLLLVSTPEKKAPFLGDSFRWTKKNPIILLFFLLWLLWWARARHEGNPLIKEDIFGQECGGLGYQDENINEFLFLKLNLRRCLAKNVASKLLRWKYIWGAASPSNLLSKKILLNSMNGCLAARDGDIFGEVERWSWENDPGQVRGVIL